VADVLRARLPISVITQAGCAVPRKRTPKLGVPTRPHHSNHITQALRRLCMRRILLSALAAVTMVSVGLVASRAAAMAPEASAGVTAAHAQLRVAAIVCGSNGCGVVQTKAVKHRKLQWLGHG
jgi:hypothetical protein